MVETLAVKQERTTDWRVHNKQTYNSHIAGVSILENLVDVIKPDYYSDYNDFR